MAHNHLLPISLTFLVLFAAANGDTATVNGLTVTGQLCCTTTGNCPGRGTGGAIVELRCLVGNGTAKFGSTTTTSTGSFTIIAATRSINTGDPSKDGVPCGVSVRLPSNAGDCGELSTAKGVLYSSLLPAGTAATSKLGLVQKATLAGFRKYNGI